MTNPTPRPALRKAQDAEVHPAAPRPARSARSAGAEPVVSPRSPAQAISAATRTSAAAPGSAPKSRSASSPAPTAKAASSAPKGSPTTTARGSTTPKTAATRRPRPVASVSPVGDDGPRKFSGSTSDHLRPEVENEPDASAPAPKATRKPDLMKGKTAELDVRVPKALRKAARARAKAEGLDLDTVVIDLLHEWVTRRR